MKLPEMKRFRWNYVGLAFALPTTVMLVLMFITSAEPFGDYSMLYSDMYHQYYPFFREFRQALLSGESLTWNWSAGGGMDYLGLISYYLGSPLNLLSIFVPEKWMLEYFSLLMPIKLGLASGFFAIMLKNFYKQNDLSLTLFGSLYGMCAWALGYQWNIMWLDSFALLPLVILGTVRLLQERRYVLYTLTLALSILSNYYIGFFVCIFVFLFFVCYQICRCKNVLRLLADLALMGLFSILAIGLTAFLELPALAALQDTYSSVNQFPEGFSTNIVSGEAVAAAREAWLLVKTARVAGEPTGQLLWEALKLSWPPVLEGMRQVAGQMGGGITPTFIDGLPNIYCGLLPVAMGFLFLLSGKIRVRDKICCVFLLLLFMNSFVIRQMDYIWHGFHFTNQIPYRFSFLFSFVLLYMAYRAWLVREEFKLWQILAGGLLAVGLVLVDPENRASAGYLIFNLAFMGLYLALMLYGNPNLQLRAAPEQSVPRQEGETALPMWMEAYPEEQVEAEPLLPEPAVRSHQAALAIACLICLELVISVVNFAAGFSIGKYDYPKKDEAVSSMLQVMKQREEGDNLFYRTEMTHAQTLNDGPLNGYNGLSTFSSSANVRVTEFMEALGYAGRNNWNRYCWEEASPVSNLFLNLKYMVERDTTPAPNDYFTALHTYKGVTLMENNYYLPLGFLAQPGLKDLDFDESSSITLQNQLFKAATGVEKNVWELLPAKDLEVTAEGDVTTNVVNMAGYTAFTAGPAGGKLIYTYTPSTAGFMCLDLTLYAQKNFTVYHNGQRLYSESYSLPMNMAVCNVQEGDEVKVVINTAVDVSTAVHIRAMVLNDEVFQEGYEILSASTLELTEFSTTYISGVIDCNRDGLLYTSIPQCGNKRWVETVTEHNRIYEIDHTEPEGNWVAYVDGERVDVVLVGDAMVALELTEGVHKVEFRYENKAFRYGALITLGCGLVLIGMVTTDHLLRRRRAGKAQ